MVAVAAGRGFRVARAGARIAFLMLCLALSPSLARGALTGSWTGDFSIPAFDGRVNACAVFRGFYVVAGDFHWAGSQAVENVARWQPDGDGGAWTPAGPGLPRPVRKLAIWNNELVAATDNHLGGSPSPVMRFDGLNWHPLGAGLYGEVDALLVDGPVLYVAGGLYRLGEVWGYRVLRWDGAEWQGVGGSFDSRILSLARYQGALIAGGEFLNAGSTFVSRIASWDGTQWNAIGGGTTSGGSQGVAALTEYAGELIAGGWFDSMGGAAGTRGIAAWDGSAWHALPNRPQDVLPKDLQVEGAVLHVAGVLQVPSQWAAGLVTFDGQTWTPSSTYPSWGVEDLAIGGNRLIAVGDFAEIVIGTSPVPSRDVIVRDSEWHSLNAWQPTMRGLLGPGWTSVMALADHHGELVAGGYFQHAAAPPYWTDCQTLARWDGSAWQPVGPERVGGWVQELLSFGNQLVIGGPGFTVRDLNSSVLAWDGNAWSDLGDPIHGYVAALTSWQGEVIVGGQLQLTGTSEACVAVHRASGWERLGTLSLNQEDVVHDVASFGGSLYAGGRFSIPGLGPRGLRRWDGSHWVEVPGSPFTNVDVMLVRQDALWVATSYGGPFQRDGVWKWDGREWTFIGGLSGNIRKLVEVDGTVMAAGWLNATDGTVTGLAQWDGTAWHSIRGAPPNGVEAVASIGRDLWIGGWFTRRGEAQAEAVARWRRDVVAGAVPLQMSQPWPTPARDHVSFRFTLPSEGRVELRVYDLRGGLVAKPIDEWLPVGTHERTWSIRTSSQPIRPGIYFARLVTPRETRGARIVIGPSGQLPAW